jgi:DNA-binding NtrC family response regulator
VDLLRGLKRLLAPEFECRVLTAESASDALQLLHDETVDVVLSDVQMPGMNGLDLLRQVRLNHPQAAVIIMTAYGTIDLAVQALKQGAYDFVTKPLDQARLSHAITNCLDHQRLLRKAAALEEQLQKRQPSPLLVGDSPALRKVLDTIAQVAKLDVTVLIRGESGTGKELAARALHAMSRRSARPMITVNCPAIPEALLESELFGYRKGAFTHAAQDHKGLLESADGSTLYLDEIGDLPAALQTKLLRTLQENEIRPLGANQVLKINLRVVASTNQDLEDKVRSGQFRQDLFYRLNVVQLSMPPLRDMREDIPQLARHFLVQCAREFGLQPKMLSAQAMQQLIDAPWPGNVRQLQNTIRRAMALCHDGCIEVEHLGIDTRAVDGICAETDDLMGRPYHQAREQMLRGFTCKYLTHHLERTRGNVSQAARDCGLERQSMQHLMRQCGIRSEIFRSGQ